MPRRPKFLDFHLSLTAELDAIRDRLAQLVGHRLTSGEHRESALRMMLRRHLPSSLEVGRGFIVAKDEASRQIDVLVVDGTRPCLYRDGDLMVVTPDLVRAIVEVKTSCSLTSRDERLPEIVSHLLTLARNGALCERGLSDSIRRPKVWTGLFVYDGAEHPEDAILQGVAEAKRQTEHSVNCIAFGKLHFVRYWGKEELERGALTVHPHSPVWHAYDFEVPERAVAPSYFLGNLIDSVSYVDRIESSFAWFPLIGGKEQYRKLVLFEEGLRLGTY